ncbi:MAG: CBS domain-containing protein [Candidatus Omnitrophica bacterium]|nr:CBS domain-containing protein [Candidatus Omnitrophota bacterium]
MKCRSCGHLNYPGADQCEKCTASLSDAYLPPPPKGKIRKMIMEETVWNAIDQGQKPVILPETESVEKAIKAFQEYQHSCLLIVNETGELAGVVTYRDISQKVALKFKDLKRVKISQIMTQRPVTLKRDDTVAVAINRMSIAGIRHIPIVDDENKPIGWISIKAVLRHLSKKSLAATSSSQA